MYEASSIIINIYSLVPIGYPLALIEVTSLVTTYWVKYFFYIKLQGAKSPPTQTYILLLSSEHKDAGDDRSSTWSCKVQLGRWSTRLTSASCKHLNNVSQRGRR